MSLSGRLQATKDESGQALVLTVVVLVVLLGFAGFAIDVGHAYLVQRQLQAGVDAAALAGAQEMPDQTQARMTAVAYGPTGPTNDVVGAAISPVNGITFKCVRTVGCSSRRARQNAITVAASSDVPTWFAKLVGRDTFTVHAKATACSPCSAKKFDVVVVLDRTGSMCNNGSGPCDRAHGRDLNNAVQGIQQFLLAMDPELDHVGFGVFPPAVGTPAHAPPDGTSSTPSNTCSAPTAADYNNWWPGWDGRGGRGSDSAVYVVGSMSDDYIHESSPNNWTLNGSSGLVQAIGCVQAGGSTSYSDALIEAKREMMRNGRGDAQDVIVFFTDGAANTMPAQVRLPDSPAPPIGTAEGIPQIDLSGYRTGGRNNGPRPCSAGVAAASWAKGVAGGTQIYTIGYDVAGSNGGDCNEFGVTASSALTNMASDPTDFYPVAAGNLGLVFERIAADLIRPSGRLIDETLS